MIGRVGAGSSDGGRAGISSPAGAGFGPDSRSTYHSVTEPVRNQETVLSRPGPNRGLASGRPRALLALLFGNVTQIHDLAVTELAAAIQSGETSAAEITEHYLGRIERLNEQVGAFYTVTHELAREQAASADKAAAASRKDGAGLPPLTGVPIPIKDLNMVAGVRLTYGSTILADNVADTDDYVVEHLRSAGIVITGKTATPEFGLPCYTETKIGPPARTPWDLTRSAGGSSGGAAAAVASGLAPAAQGSDGGGSIRIPASVCGLFGIKPTRGRISQGPMMPDLTGLSTDGPLARTVADAALLLDAMTGNHPGDMYTLPALPPGESFLGYASREPGKLRIARTIQTVVDGAEVDADCVAAWEDASALLASLGHEVEDADLPFPAEAVPSFLALWFTMAAFTPIPPAQEPELLPLTQWLREQGRTISAPDIFFHQAILQGSVRPAMTAMNAYDAILTPTVAMPPRPVGWFDEVGPAENFIRQTQFTPWTALFNLSGQPAVSVPLHWNDAGLPIGVMLAGRMGDEGTLISLSAQLEAARPWRDKHPPIWHS
jgi:amidase